VTKHLATVSTVEENPLALARQALRRLMRSDAGACTFCGRPRHEVRTLIDGPGIGICDACTALAEGVSSTGTPAGTRLGTVHPVPAHDRQARCTFCGKNRGQGAGLPALTAENSDQGALPPAICAECLSLCRQIVNGRR
jgi:hypothetical protein